ncbi:MAG: polysaccharide deacetylase family protein [Lysobacter sp.]|nr:polysaccharide deacetylase family protein [Lysobacter sp.]
MTPRPRRLHLLRLLPQAWVTTSGPGGRRALYLSFDDGPHPEHTLPLLDLLAAHDARATFFLVGNRVEQHGAVVARIVQAGHTLGNHSYDHPRFEMLPLAEQLAQIDRTDQVLGAYDQRPRHLFRTPRGVLPLPLMTHLVRQRRPIAYWSYDSLDYGRRPAPELIEIARKHPPRDNDIILMHDDSNISLQMLATLIPEWKVRGFRFEALPPA